MTPRTAKRRVRWRDLGEALMIDGQQCGWIKPMPFNGPGHRWEWAMGGFNFGYVRTRAAARRALLRACAAEKEKRR